jgi:hypothetical protein
MPPPRSRLLLDSTNVLSQDFSHLSVDDPDASIAHVHLARVCPERDTLTDNEHGTLDARILEVFSANTTFNEEPKLPALLSNISNERHKTEDPDDG